jgi:hypothetical protein
MTRIGKPKRQEPTTPEYLEAISRLYSKNQNLKVTPRVNGKDTVRNGNNPKETLGDGEGAGPQEQVA